MKIYIAHSFDDAGEGFALRNRPNAPISTFLRAIETIPLVVCDPAETPIPVSDYVGRFEYCLAQIEQSEVLVVDASNRLGLGVGAEMMFAKNRGIPVFAICPNGSHYRRNAEIEIAEWVHPFIYGLATKIFGSFDECAEALNVLCQGGKTNA